MDLLINKVFFLDFSIWNQFNLYRTTYNDMYSKVTLFRNQIKINRE